MKKILFVCTGNTCRSPMAEYIMNDMLLKEGMEEYLLCSSAGVSAMDGISASKGSIHACAKMGIDISSHKSTMIDPELLGNSDLILTMGTSHKLMLQNYFPEQCEGKIFTLGEFASICDNDILPMDVSDPYMMGNEVYERVCAQINAYLEIIINYLKGIIKNEDSDRL